MDNEKLAQKNPVTYRRATIADKAALINLSIDAYTAFSGQLSGADQQTLQVALRDEESMAALLGMATAFVCVSERNIVGMAFVLPSGNPTAIYASDWACIRKVGVHPAFAGQGIGRMLTQMCIHHAGISGEKTIALHTSELMHAARHIYETLGFKVLKEIAPIFGKRYWLYTMEL